MTTFSAKAKEVKRVWHVIDASGKTLGRLATEVAIRLRGKHKPVYTPHVDTGDYVIVINSSSVRVTGRKSKQKMYHRHTGYVGGIKSVNFAWMKNNKPTEIIRLAVKGMLPKNSLGRSMATKLKVYPGSEHLHEAQQPKLLEF